VIISAPLKCLSICECGFGTLRDEIPLGKVYKIDTATFKRARYVCGGCGRVQIVNCVMVDGKWLPRDLFRPLTKVQ
jgi:hypothetical protein